MHAESAIFRAGIPLLPLPFQHDRFASSTFMVRNIAVRLCPRTTNVFSSGFHPHGFGGKPYKTSAALCCPGDAELVLMF